MLKPELAQAQLSQYRLPEDDDRLERAATALPEELRRNACFVFGSMLEGEEKVDWQEQRRRFGAGSAALARATSAERAEVFGLIAPRLAPLMEEAWQLLATTPYQRGYSRKAFRAPQQRELAVEKQGAWLRGLSLGLKRYSPEILTPAWLAAWAGHIGETYHRVEAEIGILLAALLNRQSAEADEVFEILRQSLTNQHEIGGMGRHVYTAFLLANRSAGWELMEKTLLAAQRQEGLRQAVLEAIDESHPEAFRRMLRIVLDEDLVRFAAVVRAFDVWLGQLWAAASASVIKKMLTQMVAFLENPASREKAWVGKDAEAVYLALWAAATEDAVATVPIAEKLLASKSVEVRYVAGLHLRNLGLDVGCAASAVALRDEDLRVALLGLTQGEYEEEYEGQPIPASDTRFEDTERLLERFNDKTMKLKPIVWPWTEQEVKQSQVASVLPHLLGKRPPLRLLPHLSKLETYHRAHAFQQILDAKPWDEETRRVVVDMAGEVTAGVRDRALEALAGITLRSDEIERLCGYLTRKSSDLRRSILELLQRLQDTEAVAAAARLIAAKDAQQRLAGLELLRLLADAGRGAEDCRRHAAEYQKVRPKRSKEEQTQLDEIVREKVKVATLDDALGLMNPAERTPVTPPQRREVPMITPAAVACLKALDDLVHEHRETSVKVNTYRGTEEQLLINVHYGFPRPDFAKPAGAQAAKLPLAEVWRRWFAERGPELRDADGFELVRAGAWISECTSYNVENWTKWAKSAPHRAKLTDAVSGGQPMVKLKHPGIVKHVVDWLLFLHPSDATSYLFDAVETTLALVSDVEMDVLRKLDPTKVKAQRWSYDDDDDDEQDWRSAAAIKMWQGELSGHQTMLRRKSTPAEIVREWKLNAWLDEPFAGAPRRRCGTNVLLQAYDAGAASLTDVADHLLGKRGLGAYSSEQFDLLRLLTARKLPSEIAEIMQRHPELRSLTDRAVERILEIELARGDAVTAATEPAGQIAALEGIETLRRLLAVLGKAEYKTGYSWRSGGQDRRSSLTSLIQRTFTRADETPEQFAAVMKAAVKQGVVLEERLLQLAFLAPQWTKSVERYFEWKDLSEGVYWFLAHMNSVGSLAEAAAAIDGASDSEGNAEPAMDKCAEVSDDAEEGDSEADEGEKPAPVKKLTAWERLIVERTPLTEAERKEGAIDVAWFRRVHALLGQRRWQALSTAARFAANGAQAKRAQFIADVLSNKVPRKTLVEGIQKKQLKDHVRLLGLLPLAGGKRRDADLAERCRVLREYRRYADQLSGLTKPAALLAWQIGMKNLAQTAGFADPMRLEWAVGAEAVKDLAKGALSVTKDGVTVTLALDHLALPSVVAAKAGKELKSIPPAIKKDKKIAELVKRAVDIKRQAAAIRQSLEAAMCRGDNFSGEELRIWCGHALVAPLLARLVVVGEGILGYPDKQGKALRDHAGKLEPVKPKENLRLAHPHDLLKSKTWPAWQRECLQAERIQPFKQVFRELYVVTKQEKQDGNLSRRYDGQQIQPRQATALFGRRGWNTGDGIFKVFHDAGLTAQVWFQHGVTTPAEVEAPTLAGIGFSKREEFQPMKLTDVPPRLFSEVMRDVDLVVSVAHAGGVDPEASASTVEMRAALLRETCLLLKLKNVRIKDFHALIRGEFGDYSVHLGSGGVHLMPGGALCIVPVHAQQRGRIFLPFADDDPRTAEVVSKVLLLARDQEIQDPTILEQIRGLAASR